MPPHFLRPTGAASAAALPLCAVRAFQELEAGHGGHGHDEGHGGHGGGHGHDENCTEDSRWGGGVRGGGAVSGRKSRIDVQQDALHAVTWGTC